ncbi:MAG: DUF1338 family protein [Gammaproteobacteria bacterium]|nr:DUF1338 family protein [Gammaproteobacteria bacterium]
MKRAQEILLQLLQPLLGEVRCRRLLTRVAAPTDLRAERGTDASRALLAHALNLLLLEDLMERVPLARAYVEESFRSGRPIQFDHGALRTVKWPDCGALPNGEAAITRILLPLGYRHAADYPLPKLAMTGRAYCHIDYPSQLAQFFVSELHPEQFSAPFQQAVTRVLSTGREPLSATAQSLLQQLAERGSLPLTAALTLLPEMRACFACHHEPPRLADYELLLNESKEMAWIATEGQAYNHGTDRVADVVALADAQKAIGRPMKDAVEVSRSGRVLQTAYRACQVERLFVDTAGHLLARQVPGSFFEFITRHNTTDPITGKETIDLSFDAANATGIFKMTAG